MVRICLYVHVCVAPPMIVGAWPMAVVAALEKGGIYTQAHVMHFSAFTFLVHVYSSDTTDELMIIAMENK